MKNAMQDADADVDAEINILYACACTHKFNLHADVHLTNDKSEQTKIYLDSK